MCNVSSRLGEHCLAGCCGGMVALRTKARMINGIEVSIDGRDVILVNILIHMVCTLRHICAYFKATRD